MDDCVETERLVLRRFALDDAAAFLPLVSLPEVLRYTGECPIQSVRAVEELLSTHQLSDYRARGYGRMACIEKSTGRLVGFSGLKFLQDMGETDIGYRFLPDCWGLGYATESARAMVRTQPQRFGIHRIIGLVQPANHGSVRVLTKLSLKFEKQVMAGDHEPLDQYALMLA